jgi:hypothetical protein
VLRRRSKDDAYLLPPADKRQALHAISPVTLYLSGFAIYLPPIVQPQLQQSICNAAQWSGLDVDSFVTSALPRNCASAARTLRYKTNRRAGLPTDIKSSSRSPRPPAIQFSTFYSFETKLVIQPSLSLSPTAMSSFRQVVVNGKTIVVSVAETVVTGSGSTFCRPVHALDQGLLEQSLGRTENAIKSQTRFHQNLREKFAVLNSRKSCLAFFPAETSAYFFE